MTDSTSTPDIDQDNHLTPPGASTVLERNSPERERDHTYSRRALLPRLGAPELAGVIGTCVIRQTDGFHQVRGSTITGVEVTPASLHELQTAVPELSLRPGQFVLLRHPATWPDDRPLDLAPDTLVCAWTGEWQGVYLMSFEDYCARVPLAYQQPMAISELLAAFEAVPIGTEPLTDEFPALPRLRRDRFDVYQSGLDGERMRFSQQTGRGKLVPDGIFALLGYDREATDDDIVDNDANENFMRWADVKRRYKSASGRHYDSVLLQTFRRVL